MTGISQPFFPERNIFHFSYAEESLPMKARSATKCGFKRELKKKKKEAVACARRVLQCCQLPEKIPAVFERYLEFFAVSGFLVFIIIPRFPAERLTIFCRILAGKHWTSPQAGWLKNRASTCSRGRDISLLHNTQTSYSPPPFHFSRQQWGKADRCEVATYLCTVPSSDVFMV